jgi:hypothetical protein
VAVSGLELTQNSIRLSWLGEEVENRLKIIMKGIHDTCLDAAEAYGRPGNYFLGPISPVSSRSPMPCWTRGLFNEAAVAAPEMHRPDTICRGNLRSVLIQYRPRTHNEPFGIRTKEPGNCRQMHKRPS